MKTRLEFINNPMGLRISDNKWQGKITPSVDKEFEQFEDMEHGIRAGCKNFRTYQNKYGLRTVPELIHRHAPPVENNTDAYVYDVLRRMDVRADQILDLNRFDTLFNLACAVISHENGQLEIPLEVIEEGVRAAL